MLLANSFISTIILSLVYCKPLIKLDLKQWGKVAMGAKLTIRSRPLHPHPSRNSSIFLLGRFSADLLAVRGIWNPPEMFQRFYLLNQVLKHFK